MVYFESFSQGCNASMPEVDEEKRIYAHIPDFVGDGYWSDYAPFYASVSYKKLYAGKDRYFVGSLVFNAANEALIIRRATDFYNGLGK